jgi:hypothetical protein
MSKLTDSLAERNVYNPHNFASAAKERGGTGVTVIFDPADRGRGGHGARFVVLDVTRPTDPGGPWYHYGRKVFAVGWYHDRPTARQAAIDWAAEWTGTDPADWVPGPFRGSVVHRDDKRRVLDHLRTGG